MEFKHSCDREHTFSNKGHWEVSNWATLDSGLIRNSSACCISFNRAETFSQLNFGSACLLNKQEERRDDFWNPCHWTLGTSGWIQIFYQNHGSADGIRKRNSGPIISSLSMPHMLENFSGSCVISGFCLLYIMTTKY